MTDDSWSSIPWTPFPMQQEPSSPPASWCKHQVPYTSQANSLQNLEVWIPNISTEPSAAETPNRPGIWIIYIHGGAWRDPLVDASSFTNTVSTLLSSPSHSATLSKIAGLASLNYSLSPHPTHPTHATPAPDSNTPAIPSRNAKHPTHILDVLSGISYLQNKFPFQQNYVLAGHSCGATLALQAAMEPSRWQPASPPPSPPSSQRTTSHIKPHTILGLNGLYDLPSLIHSPGSQHQPLARLYRTFTAGAFGEDDSAWADVSPTCVEDWSVEWREGRSMFLVQSREDTLVPYSQTELVKESLSRRKGIEVRQLEATGDHNDLWREGGRLADILAEVVEMAGERCK